MAKRRPFKAGFRPLKKQDSKVITWCIKNGISICVVPCSKYSWPKNDFGIEIVIKDKTNIGPCFPKQEVLEKQIEYYYYYYDKYNKTS